eukprot:TRINITY_DN844_c2_g1_i1.p1 TRINITY_DN844_c2_g1~~TRINITY_DN844_c2_g1_i1.p1  ORF type:complete len:409 (-),score=25.97 TRINITY_DN844_c2_g1_i1:234-1460(-)
MAIDGGVERNSTIHSGASVFVFFDFESTGLHINYAEIIEIASSACLLRDDGTWHKLDPDFRILVQPSRKLPKRIARMCAISDAQLRQEGTDFRGAMNAWVAWLRGRIECATMSFSDGNIVPQLWLVGHNVLAYDLPLLVAQDARERRREEYRSLGLNRAPVLFEGVDILVGFVDTLRLSRANAAAMNSRTSSHRLGALYEHAFGTPLPDAHTAGGDVRGLMKLCAGPLRSALIAAVAAANSPSMTQQSVRARSPAVFFREAFARAQTSAKRSARPKQRQATAKDSHCDLQKQRTSRTRDVSVSAATGLHRGKRRMSFQVVSARARRRTYATGPGNASRQPKRFESLQMGSETVYDLDDHLGDRLQHFVGLQVKPHAQAEVQLTSCCGPKIKHRRWKRGVLRCALLLRL